MSELEKLIATYGPVGAVAVLVATVLIKTGFLFRPDHREDELNAKLDRMNDKLDAIRDRTTMVEAELKALSRRVDRFDK